MTPFRITVQGTCGIPLDTLRANASANDHYPQVQTHPLHSRKLAIVGGGPLIVDNLDELRMWDGDIWGINDTAQWLNERGITATLFTVDAIQKPVEAPDAIIATWCSPELFQTFEGRVQGFRMAQTHPEDGLHNGAFSATSAPAVSLKMGYRNVSFFGCEGSYEAQSHVDRQEAKTPFEESQLIVRAGGKDYLTLPRYLVQCEELSKLFVFDNVYHNRSGGLLKAIIENPDTWEVVAVSAALKESLEAHNGKHGIYEEPYRPAA